MEHAVLYLAALIGCVSAFMGNRTAWALLASLAASFYVTSSVGLFLLDVAVLCLVVRRNMGLADEFIAALFLFAWPFYFTDGWLRYEASWAVVALQLILTAPLNKWQRGLELFSHGPLRGKRCGGV